MEAGEGWGEGGVSRPLLNPPPPPQPLPLLRSRLIRQVRAASSRDSLGLTRSHNSWKWNTLLYFITFPSGELSLYSVQESIVLLLGALGGAVNSSIITPELPEIAWSPGVAVLSVVLPLGASPLNICLGRWNRENIRDSSIFRRLPVSLD